MKRILMMAFALFFVLALAGIVLAEGKTYPLGYDFKGRVTSVDFLSRS